jgi:hypothetical protein
MLLLVLLVGVEVVVHVHVLHVVLDLSFHQSEDFRQNGCFFFLEKTIVSSKTLRERERRRRRSCFNVEIKKAKSISSCLE